MRQRTTCLLSLAAAVIFIIDAPFAQAEAVDGTWVNVVNQPDPLIAGPIWDANTNHPIVGDDVELPDNSNFADQEMVYSPFSLMTLTNPGDKVVFTGTVDLEGTLNSPPTSGNPRTQYRFGLFKDTGNDVDADTGWIGYYMSTKHGNAGTPAGTLALKPALNTSTPLSVTGQTVLTSAQGDGTDASLFNDGNYAMNMTIERDINGELHVSATLIGFGFRNDGVTPNTYSHGLSATHIDAATAGTYQFDRLVFLSGNNLDTDRMAFSDLDVTFMPGVASGLLGDFNEDDKVDAADYVIWRKNETANNPLPNDNGVATQAERFELWKANFGEMPGAGGGAGAIPEPASAALAMFGALVVAFRRRRARLVRY
jgi:hypothetical protein